MSETEPLYAISDRYRAALMDFEDAPDDLPVEVIRDTMDALEGEFRDKAINVAKYLLGLGGSIEAIIEEETRLKTRRKHMEAHEESLKEYLHSNMTRCEITRIDCPLFALRIQKNPPSVVIDDANAVPDFYKEQEIIEKILKRELKDDLSRGIPIEGAHLEQTTRLVIK